MTPHDADRAHLTPHDAGRPSADALSATLGALLGAARGLPRFQLYPEERMRLSGSAFSEAPELVDAICRAVEEGGDLLADVPFDPAAARRGVERARWYQRLGCALRRLAQRADDLALFEQAEATRASLDVLAAGRCRIAEPFQQARARRLHHALRPAEAILARRHARSSAPRAAAALTVGPTSAIAPAGAGRRAAAAARPNGRSSGARRRAAARPRFSSDSFLRRLDASAARAPGAEPQGQRDASAERSCAAAERSPPSLDHPGAAPRSPSKPQGAHAMAPPPDLTTPTPAPTPAPATPVDLADAAELDAIRGEVTRCDGQLGLDVIDAEARAAAPRTLSAAELAATQAAVGFLQRRPDFAQRGGDLTELLPRRFAADLALHRLATAAGQLEASAAVGEIVLSARLTEQNDSVFSVIEGDAFSQDEREEIAGFLASADLIYERAQELAQGRRDRAALRRARHGEEQTAARGETERLRAHERLQAGLTTDKGRAP